MKCFCCNVILTDYEATRRSATTGEFLDICNACIKGLGISTIDRPDLAGPVEKVSIYEDPDYNDWGHLVFSEKDWSEE